MEEKKEKTTFENPEDTQNQVNEQSAPGIVTPEEWNTLAEDIKRVGYLFVLVDCPEKASVFTVENLYDFARKNDFALVFLPKYNWALIASTINEIPIYLYRHDKRNMHLLLEHLKHREHSKQQ